MKITVKDFIKKFRTLIGDETASVPSGLILTGLNWALNSLPSVPKLDKAFAKHYTTQLRADRHYKFKLNKDFRYISNSPMINFFTSTGGDPCPLNVCYKDTATFFKLNGLVELKQPGTPCTYTLERDGDDLYLIFDRPLNIPMIIDYIVWGYPKPIESITTSRTILKDGRKRVEKQDVYIDLSAPIENLILTTMRKVFYEEADDLAFSGAFTDYLDSKQLPEIIQMVNKQFKAGTPIIVGEQ